MYWIMSLLGALIVTGLLGYVVALSVGRGEDLPPTQDREKGRPISPAAMEHHRHLTESPIAAESVRGIRFNLAWRGYDQAQVDAYLERVSRQLAAYEQHMAGDSARPHSPAEPIQPVDSMDKGDIK